MAGVALLLFTGCDSRPSAPVLRDAPFYQNDTEGIRFLVPEGWRQTTAASLPPGNFKDEVFLVKYSMTTPEGGAVMSILVKQLAADASLTEHLSGPSFGILQWTMDSEPQSVTINDRKLDHYVLSANVNGRSLTKNAYCFRQGSRLYTFVSVYSRNDSYAEQQFTRAVESLQST